MLKTNTERKKNNETYSTFHGPLSQEWINGRYWSSAVTRYANQRNEYYKTLIQDCVEIMSQYPIRKVILTSPATSLVWNNVTGMIK